MPCLVALMSTLLVAFLVVSTSANRPSLWNPYGRPRASENQPDDFIFDHMDDDYGIQTDQGILKEQLEITEDSHPMQDLYYKRPIKTSGRRATTKFPRKPITSAKKFTTKKPNTQKPPSSGCGVSVHHSKIIGGRKVDVDGKFPWMVALLWTKIQKGKWTQFCGGALISSRHILTAAHCLTEVYVLKPSEVMVRLGESNMDMERASDSRRDVAVSKIFVHEGHDLRKHINDITILQLKERIDLNAMIRPICLPNAAGRSPNFDGKMATVAGWGDTVEGSEKGSKFLMEVELPLVGHTQCQKSYNNTEELLYALPIYKEQICAGFPDGEKDSCQGDSGGPLMFQAALSKPWTVVGVTSWGHGCARVGFPGVYARVESYHDWIQSKMAIE